MVLKSSSHETKQKVSRAGGKARREAASEQEWSEFSRKGGAALAKQMTPEQRQARAKNAARARWAKKPDQPAVQG